MRNPHVIDNEQQNLTPPPDSIDDRDPDDMPKIDHYTNRCIGSVLMRFPDMDNDENKAKFPYIRELVNRNIITTPTPSLMYDMMIVEKDHLALILEKGEVFDKRNAQVYPCAVEQSCHAISALAIVMDPSQTLCHGISDKTNYHSWILSENGQVLYEPTPVIRLKYFGYKVEDRLNFVKDEEHEIRRLIKTKQLTKFMGLMFDVKLKKFYDDNGG